MYIHNSAFTAQERVWCARELNAAEINIPVPADEHYRALSSACIRFYRKISPYAYIYTHLTAESASTLNEGVNNLAIDFFYNEEEQTDLSTAASTGNNVDIAFFFQQAIACRVYNVFWGLLHLRTNVLYTRGNLPGRDKLSN